MIFSRNRGKADQAGERDASRAGRHSRQGQVGRVDAEDVQTPAPPEFGPYDVTEAPEDDVSRFDLGALRIPNVPGVGIQLEAAPDGGIARVQLEHDGSRLQLGVFAAPRSEGVWDEIRDELRAALNRSGAKIAEVDGDYGLELQARFGNAGTVIEVRHVGIDGPRWFVHGVYVGAAAVDPAQAGLLREALRGLVVDRGVEARPVKEALPLRLPAEAAAQLAELVANDDAEAAQELTAAAALAPPAIATGAAPSNAGRPAKKVPAKARRTTGGAT